MADLADTPNPFLAISDSDLVYMHHDVTDKIAVFEAEHEKRMYDHRKMKLALDAEILRRIKASGGSRLLHPEFVVEREAKLEYIKDYNELAKLEKLVPADELNKAYGLKYVEPQPYANATQLKGLVKKYGENSEVGQIISRGLVQAETGVVKLVIKPRETLQHVSTTEAIAA